MKGEHKEKEPRKLVLIVDDSKLNRNLLSDILSDEYDIVEAENGATALKIIAAKRSSLACVLLDITMQMVNGFEVLECMNNNNWLISLPVIIISAENSVEYIRKGYELGAIDYINRPFYADIVKRRVQNTINLYSKQKKLSSMVIKQYIENEHINNLMISILGHIVEFRNKESNDHVNRVSLITRLMLEQMNKHKTKYHFTLEEIKNISRAAALHDIGKICIPDEILNKPDKLTPEEFTVMKSHSEIGAEMIKNINTYKDEPLIKVSYNICRWHHERYDGKGYPDGLKGDEIPIEAQIVSLADVYDALTSERCYKPIYNHEKALNMIMNNECGVFNPELLNCFRSICKDLPGLLVTN